MRETVYWQTGATGDRAWGPAVQAFGGRAQRLGLQATVDYGSDPIRRMLWRGALSRLAVATTVWRSVKRPHRSR